MNTKARKNRYTGVDVSDWKVVNVEGKELSLPKTVKDELTGEIKEILVTRFNGYKTAAVAASKLAGYAVRA